MSLRPYPVEPVPEETAQVAHAAFPHGNLYLTLRDTLGTEDLPCASVSGRPDASCSRSRARSRS